MSTPIQRAIDALNHALRDDPEAIEALLRFSVECNGALAMHPTVQVGDAEAGAYTVRPLGLLNGAIEAATGERIAAQYDGERLIGFTLYTQPHNRREEV